MNWYGPRTRCHLSHNEIDQPILGPTVITIRPERPNDGDTWYSICTTHYGSYIEDCAHCNVGDWVSKRDVARSKRLYSIDRWLWYEWVHRKSFSYIAIIGPLSKSFRVKGQRILSMDLGKEGNSLLKILDKHADTMDIKHIKVIAGRLRFILVKRRIHKILDSVLGNTLE